MLAIPGGRETPEQVVPGVSAQEHIVICTQAGHSRQCTITWEQFGRALHHAADHADRNPRRLICARCYAEFAIYIIRNNRYMFAGELEGTVRILAESQAGVPSDAEASVDSVPSRGGQESD